MRASVIAVALIAVGIGIAPGSPPGHAARTKPVVTIVGRTPLTVAGAWFAPGERVIVTLVRATPTRKRAYVDRQGRFFVRFPGVRVSRCSSMVVTALSLRGTTRLTGGAPNCKSG